jgi:catechol 2,3-dioxygenase-like lactoylglutathione lyase family enzyme
MLLKEIQLQTNHLSALYHFYKDVLELNTVYSNKKSISIAAGKSFLIFEETTAGINPFYHFAFNIPSNKFEEAFEWIKQKVELLWLDDYKSYIADFVNWHAKSFYFLDPAGNILELIARFDLNDIVDETFSSVHVRNVSEIGLVFPVKSFDSDVNKLLEQYQLSHFDKQPPMPHFRAVGDDEGLFVIVPEDSIWFSTKNTVAKLFAVEINFLQHDVSLELKV